MIVQATAQPGKEVTLSIRKPMLDGFSIEYPAAARQLRGQSPRFESYVPHRQERLRHALHLVAHQRHRAIQKSDQCRWRRPYSRYSVHLPIGA